MHYVELLGNKYTNHSFDLQISLVRLIRIKVHVEVEVRIIGMVQLIL